jgi:hypothetical protein
MSLPGQWIGRRGSVAWPARSPYLVPLNFYFWGYVKDKVKPKNEYAGLIQNMDYCGF